MKREYVFLFVAVALAGVTTWLVLTMQGSQIDTASIAAWSTQQGVAAGRTQTLRLPAPLAKYVRDGVVTIAHQDNGRYCFLVKTEIGWKDNFRGLLWCTAPLAKSEIVTPGDNRSQYVSIPGYGVFEELYVQRFRSDRFAEVYFDLN